MQDQHQRGYFPVFSGVRTKPRAGIRIQSLPHRIPHFCKTHCGRTTYVGLFSRLSGQSRNLAINFQLRKPTDKVVSCVNATLGEAFNYANF